MVNGFQHVVLVGSGLAGRFPELELRKHLAHRAQAALERSFLAPRKRGAIAV